MAVRMGGNWQMQICTFVTPRTYLLGSHLFWRDNTTSSDLLNHSAPPFCRHHAAVCDLRSNSVRLELDGRREHRSRLQPGQCGSPQRGQPGEHHQQRYCSLDLESKCLLGWTVNVFCRNLLEFQILKVSGLNTFIKKGDYFLYLSEKAKTFVFGNDESCWKLKTVTTVFSANQLLRTFGGRARSCTQLHVAAFQRRWELTQKCPDDKTWWQTAIDLKYTQSLLRRERQEFTQNLKDELLLWANEHH